MLSRSGKVAGVIRALTYQPRDFTQRQVNLIQQFANGAAIALDNARLLQEMTAKNTEIESVNFRLGQLLAEQNALREIFTGINLLDLDALLRQLAEHAAKLLSADHIVVRLLNKQGALETVALVGEGAESLRDQVLISGTRRSTWVIENRRPLAIRDISQDKIFGPGHLMRAMGVKGYLCFPLISRDRKPIGTLQVTTLTEREFQQDEIILAQQFASVAAIAIENARLYEEVQQKSQELEDAFKAKTAFLNTMAHELRTPLNVMVGTQQLILDGVYGEVSEEAKKGLKVIGRQAFTMVQLINEILDLARVEAGRLALHLARIGVPPALTQVLDGFRPQAEAEKHRVIQVRAPGGQAGERPGNWSAGTGAAHANLAKRIFQHSNTAGNILQQVHAEVKTDKEGGICGSQHLAEKFAGGFLLLADQILLAHAGINQQSQRQRQSRLAGEVDDLLRLALLANLEVRFVEIGDQPSPAVPDRAEHVHDRHIHLDGGRGPVGDGRSQLAVSGREQQPRNESPSSRLEWKHSALLGRSLC